MKYQWSLLVLCGSGILALVLIACGVLLAGFLIILMAILQAVAFYRCPHCKKSLLGDYIANHCPHCGGELFPFYEQENKRDGSLK